MSFKNHHNQKKTKLDENWKEKLLWVLWSSLGLGKTRASMFYSFLIAIVMGIFVLNALIIDAKTDFGVSPHMKTTTAVVVRFSDQLSCVFAALIVGFLPRKRLTLLNSNLPSASKFDFILTIVFFSVMLVVFVGDFAVWLEQDPYYYVYFPVYILHFVVMGLETLFAVVVMKVGREFSKLNKTASYLLLKNKSQKISISTVLPSIDSASLGANINVREDEAILENLGDKHWSLCNQVEEVNNIFGVGVLAAMFSVFIHVVITPYFFFLSFMYPSEYGIDKTHFLFLQIILTAMYAAKLVLLVWPCSSTIEQATLTKRIVAKYMNKGLLSVHQQYQLENVTLQLLHQDVQFTACGLLDLDLPLITSITGAVTTYLVILIQFQNSSTT